MADEYKPGIPDDAAKIKADKKKLKADQKAQKKEAKRRAKELAAREEDLEEDSSGPVIITTLVIIVVWVGIICALVKLDIGGFGSQVLAPVLKNVPVVNKILPDETTGNTSVDTEENIVDLAGYSSLEEAVEDIHDLEEELIDNQSYEYRRTYTSQGTYQY